MSEQKTFVFAVTFIIIFATFLSTIPVGLLGEGSEPDMIGSVDPSVVAGFTDTETYQQSNFSGIFYEYDLGGRTWRCEGYDTYFRLATKVFVFGFLWLGGLDRVKFISPEGVNRGEALLFSEIETDASEGTISYELLYVDTGNAAGSFIVYWNITEYTDPKDAWDNDVIYLMHGVGLESTAVIDIGTLLLDLLTLQIPEVPLLVNVLLAVPIWASIVYLIWFIIKEMIPFL